MKIRNFVTGAIVAAAVAATAACGSDDSGSDLPPVPTADSSTSAASGSTSSADGGMTDPNKVPSIKALNEMLETALDPKVDASEKTELVEGSEADPKLFDQLVKAAKDNPDVTYKIKPPVTKNGPKKAKVKVEVKVPGNPAQPIDAAIVYDNGRWKLSKSTVCPLLSANDVDSVLCADDSPSSSAKASKKKSS
ncbi:hypothetical protein L5G28_13870 [Gordonia sp. HY285]|uniref:hypothetical protein n=1 Tax=Gordonia liuliyuniae TaxID=2911517 RepID=UPI001F188577|nr:hypothetical protein [Gordonia liuliyuniae]MCF8611234.1 hypothetical protein [Gordonia liuliyuniae]